MANMCERSLPAMDRCVQIFVERDLPVLEGYVKWKMTLERQNRGRPIVIDGPELDTHCR